MRNSNPPPVSRNRRSIRLRGYDYSQAGAYFVTVVVQGRACLFGEMVGEEMRLNDAGEMIHRVWQELPGRFPDVETDEFIVMPNHVHGVIWLNQPVEVDPRVGAPLVGAQAAEPPDAGGRETHPHETASERAATDERATTRVAPTLGGVIGGFKSLTTVAYVRGVKTQRWPRFSGKLWQRNYFEHVVRSEDSLAKIREYIHGNPARWEFDRENPAVASHAPYGS